MPCSLWFHDSGYAFDVIHQCTSSRRNNIAEVSDRSLPVAPGLGIASRRVENEFFGETAEVPFGFMFGDPPAQLSYYDMIDDEEHGDSTHALEEWDFRKMDITAMVFVVYSIIVGEPHWWIPDDESDWDFRNFSRKFMVDPMASNDEYVSKRNAFIRHHAEVILGGMERRIQPYMEEFGHIWQLLLDLLNSDDMSGRVEQFLMDEEIL